MGNRGTTKSRRGDATNWAGDDFKKDSEEKLEESGVKYITAGRGTKKISVEKTKTSKKKKYKGKISTGRGTGTR